MYIQTVTYELEGINEEDYLSMATDVAPEYASLPGLQAKLWLANSEDNVYGAVYMWDDEESMQRYMQSDLFEGANPEFRDVYSEGFEVLENLTRQTQPVLEIVEEGPPERPVKPILGRGGDATKAAKAKATPAPKPAKATKAIKTTKAAKAAKTAKGTGRAGRS